MKSAIASIMILLAPVPAIADSCSENNLGECVKELNSKILNLQNQLQTERARVNFYGDIACNMALSIHKLAPSDDAAATVDAACAEINERIAAMKTQTLQKPNSPSK
jgi:hypothetical protein